MAMCIEVTHTPCATSSKEQTGNILTFAQFEEGNLVSETHNNVESGDESDDNSIMQPLLSEEKMDAMNYDDKQMMNLCLQICKNTFVTVFSTIQTLMGDTHVIKYVIVLSKDNWNRKKRSNLCETWVKVYKRCLRLL